MNYEKIIKLDKENEIIKIIISCAPKKYSVDEDFIFNENIRLLIPDEYRDKAILLEAPGKFVSNLNYIDHATEGCWIFRIKKEEDKKTTTRKQTTRTRKAKSSATRTTRSK